MMPRQLTRIISSSAVVFLICIPGGFAKSYERIVSLAPSVTEILFAIGADNRLVGVTTYCDFPAEAKQKPKVGGFTEHSLEAIAAQRPDLVMMVPNRGTKFTYEKLKQLGIETSVVPLYSLNDLVRSYDVIGEKVGNAEQARKLQTQLVETIDQARKESAARQPRRVAFVNWHTPLIVPAPGTLEGDVIELVGGENIVKNGSQHYPKLGVEFLFASDPDLIIDTSSHGEDVDREVFKKVVREFWSKYKELRAVKSGDIYVFRRDVYSVPGPRTVRFIEAMNALFDPATKPENEYYERVRI